MGETEQVFLVAPRLRVLPWILPLGYPEAPRSSLQSRLHQIPDSGRSSVQIIMGHFTRATFRTVVSVAVMTRIR